MPDTLVIQSTPLPVSVPWLQACMASVANWAQINGWGYRVLGDELFDPVPADLMARLVGQKVIATDLGRLFALRQALAQGYTNVIWCDADFLVFEPAPFALPDNDFAVGREVWIQQEEAGLKARIKVHNAFLLFRQGNSFLDFYLDSALRLVEQNTGAMPPQFVGPKLLTAIHNVVQCPVLETAAMFSPAVVEDVCAGGGLALNLFNQRSRRPPLAANLCSSLVSRGELTAETMELAIDRLLSGGGGIFGCA